MEAVRVLSGPVLPQDMGLLVLFTCLIERRLRNTHTLGGGIGVDQLAEPVFCFTHLALGVVDDRLYFVEFFLNRAVRVTAETGGLDGELGFDHTVGREHLAVLPFLLGHVALMTLYAGLVVHASGIGLRFRMLEFDQAGAGHGVLEIEEIEFLVMFQQLQCVLEREVVGSLVGVCDRLAITPLGAGAAGVLDMALGAHHARVGFSHNADFAEIIAEGDDFQIGLAAFGKNIVLGILLDGLDQTVPHYAGLGSVRVVAVDASDRAMGVLGDIHNVGGTVPLGFGILVAHELPLQDVVGGLALDTGRIAGHTGFFQFVVNALVDQHIPGLAGFINTFPAILELETAALETIHDKLIDDHEGVTARLIVLKGKSVGGQQLVLHGRTAGWNPLLLAGAAIAVDAVETFHLTIVALAAQLLVDDRDRLVLLRIVHVGVKLVMAGRAGKLGVPRPLLEGLDLVVTLVTFCPDVVDYLCRRFCLGSGRHGGD